MVNRSEGVKARFEVAEKEPWTPELHFLSEELGLDKNPCKNGDNPAIHLQRSSIVVLNAISGTLQKTQSVLQVNISLPVMPT